MVGLHSCVRVLPGACALALSGLLVTAMRTPPDEVPLYTVPDSEPTPYCPEPVGVLAPCSYVKVHGNVYNDNNHNGRYDPNTGDTRLAGAEITLYNLELGTPLGRALTNSNGYYAFPLLPVGPSFRVEVAEPPGYRPTTVTSHDLELRDFSTYWCCTGRADFGFLPGQAPSTPAPPASPPPLIPPGVTPVPPPYCEIPPGRQTHLPILNYEANENVCSSVIEVQNVGAWPSKALLVLWGAPGFCPPQCSGPLKVECSGLLVPGSSWYFMGAQLPSRAKSGMVFSAPAMDVPGGAAASGDIFADLLCQTLYHEVVGNCDSYRRFKKAFSENGIWWASNYAFDFAAYPGASMAVEVVRKCPGDANPMVSVTSAYSGLSDEMIGAYDPVYGGYTFFAPLVYANRDGQDTWLYIQNGGLECTSAEVWFQAQDDCLRPTICAELTIAPGETRELDAASCVPAGFVGSAWVRGSQPLSVVVDIIGRDMLMTYHGHPGELKYVFEGVPMSTAGSPVAYGPLLYSEYQGWDSRVQVQNLSRVTNAKVKVYFLDRSGDVIVTLSDWICPGGSQGYSLPLVSTLPGNWIGSVRVESQDWFAPGQPGVSAPNIAGVVELVKYADVTRAVPLEAIAYDLLPEQRAFDWQVGSGWGGLYSGVGRIGIPSLAKDVGGTGLTSEIAIANVVPKPGFTDFIVYIYDQNGLVSSVCQQLGELQVEYIDVAGNMAILPSGFKGSAIVSAVFWEHDVFDDQGQFRRNLVGLAVAKVERSQTILGSDIPGDESAGSEGFPIVGPFAFGGPVIHCPGVPHRIPCCPPPSPTPPLPSGPPPTATAPMPGAPTPSPTVPGQPPYPTSLPPLATATTGAPPGPP